MTLTEDLRAALVDTARELAEARSALLRLALATEALDWRGPSHEARAALDAAFALADPDGAHRRAAARAARELLDRVDALERGIGQMRLLAGLPLPPDVVAKLAEADRLRRLFDAALARAEQAERERDTYRSAAERTTSVDAAECKACPGRAACACPPGEMCEGSVAP